MKVLVLYSEVMSYTISTLREIEAQGVEIVVVSWDKRKLSAYQETFAQTTKHFKRSTLSTMHIIRLAREINPDITVVSGWQDFGYLLAAFFLRLRGKTVVSGFDGQKSCSFKHFMGSVLGRLGVFKLFFSHAWIPGARQYDFASMLGYKKAQVIFDLYSCDTKIFKVGTLNSSGSRNNALPHKFLFVGRLEVEKGVDHLLDAWLNLENKKRDWTLTIIGSGSLANKLPMNSDSLNAIEFIHPSELAEVFRKHGCLILPSRFEPWGVVVHEAASSGLPLLLSDEVGASSTFLIDNYNGHLFKSRSVEAIEKAMLKIIESSDQKLMEMSLASELLSRRITPLTSALNLLSISQQNWELDSGMISNASHSGRPR